MPSAETTVYLIRHGATEANERRPYILQGRGINHGLSEQGRAQARSAGEFLRRYPLQHVYCSPMLRAMETAQEIARPHGVEVRPLEGLQEVDVGAWEGLDWGTIENQFPEAYLAFRSDPWETPYLGGESYAAVLARVQPLFERLFETHAGERIAVVAHNVVNRAYLAHVLGLEMRRAKDLRQSNTGINIIRRRDGETHVMTLNGTFHLERPSD